jgi:putative Ca2+/H+ antiporter (TMEM165/GDT1 family)
VLLSVSLIALTMSAFLLALLAALVAGLGARDQMVVAELAARRGPGPGLLVTAMAVALLSAAIAGWLGGQVAPQLLPRARSILVAMALGLAALELVVLRPRRQAAEPTESLGALAVVLLAHQVTDAARLLVFAIAAASAVPVLAMLGGAAGCGLSMVMAVIGGADLLRLPLRWMRTGLGVVLGLIAIYLVA